MKYVADTSAIIEKAVTRLANEKKIEGTILIPNAVIAELENQANKGLEIGFLGLEEIQEIRQLKKIKLEFIGDRPNEKQIKFAKSGEIDAFIREIAYNEKAILITGDKVQSESAKAFGLKVIYLERKEAKEKLEFENLFDDRTMSVHIKEDSFCFAKKGKPGEWQLVKVGETKLTAKEIEDMAKEIIEKSRIDPKTFIEISRRGSTIIQYHDYRIVIVRPPVSDGWEMTVVKPLKKLKLEEYHLKEKLFERIKEKSRGIIVAGEPGSGKSTFCQALGEFYLKQGRIIKTVESPRDLQLSDEITQYSKNFTSSQEIHDILFLSRPDNIIFDEMRDTPDFELYGDLRLAGAECIGVVHSSSPIDAVQRFIPRVEVGMIPSIVDTILFVEKGNIGKVLGLKMVVKVPTGMTESDLARPIVEVRDFETERLEYEIYSYGEQTVVIPVVEVNVKDSVKNLAKIAIEREFKKYCKECNAEVISSNRVIVEVPERDIARIIGKEGKVISQIEKDLGIGIEIKELKEEKKEIEFKVQEDKKTVRFFIEPGREVQILISGKLLLTAYSSRKGEIKIHKESQVGRKITEALHSGKKVEVKG